MSYSVPQTFARRLREFDPNLRVRWSNRTHTFHIESKVGRAAEIFALPHNDGAVRLRDGYQLVCEVTAGTQMWCHQQVTADGDVCGYPLPVPMMEFREVVCPMCRARGRDGRHVYGYFGWGEQLLDHLKLIDPRNKWRWTLRAEADLTNQRLQESRERDTLNQLTSVALEERFRTTGVSQVYLSK